MRTPLVITIAAFVLACASNSASSSATASPAPMQVNATGKAGEAAATRMVKVSAKVKAIDKAKRELTVEGEGGTETFQVPPEVKRFDEIAVGDTIVVEAEQGLLLDYQPPGTADVEPQAVIASGTADAVSAPAGAAAGGIMATVTVTAIDMGKRLVTLQGPGGNTYHVAAGPKVQLDRLKVGDKLVATYVESIAVGIEKQWQ